MKVDSHLTSQLLFRLVSFSLGPRGGGGVVLEIVMNEMRKNQTFHFDLQIHPTHP